MRSESCWIFGWDRTPGLLQTDHGSDKELGALVMIISPNEKQPVHGEFVLQAAIGV